MERSDHVVLADTGGQHKEGIDRLVGGSQVPHDRAGGLQLPAVIISSARFAMQHHHQQITLAGLNARGDVELKGNWKSVCDSIGVERAGNRLRHDLSVTSAGTSDGQESQHELVFLVMRKDRRLADEKIVGIWMRPSIVHAK